MWGPANVVSPRLNVNGDGPGENVSAPNAKKVKSVSIEYALYLLITLKVIKGGLKKHIERDGPVIKQGINQQTSSVAILSALLMTVAIDMCLNTNSYLASDVKDTSRKLYVMFSVWSFVGLCCSTCLCVFILFVTSIIPDEAFPKIEQQPFHQLIIGTSVYFLVSGFLLGLIAALLWAHETFDGTTFWGCLGPGCGMAFLAVAAALRLTINCNSGIEEYLIDYQGSSFEKKTYSENEVATSGN